MNHKITGDGILFMGPEPNPRCRQLKIPLLSQHVYYSALYGKRFVQTLMQLKLTRTIYLCVYAIGDKQG